MSKRNIVHIEFPAKDRKVARDFYGKLFGWDFKDFDDMNYTTFDSGSVGGGFNPLSNDVKPGDVMVYIDSPDIEADLKKIEAAGGKVHVPKTEIPGQGWFAVFEDPTGNAIALYTANMPG